MLNYFYAAIGVSGLKLENVEFFKLSQYKCYIFHFTSASNVTFLGDIRLKTSDFPLKQGILGLFSLILPLKQVVFHQIHLILTK